MVEASGLEGKGDNHRASTAALAAALGLGALLFAAMPAAAQSQATAQIQASQTAEPCPAGRPLLMRQARLDDLAGRIAAKTGLNVLAIGSSSTRGIGASSPAYSYPALFEEDLKRTFHAKVSVTNAGVNGETADATVSRLEERLAAEKFDLVIWQVGTNDAVKGADEEKFRAMLERGLSAAKAAQTDIVLLDPQFFPTVKDPARYERFVKLVEKVGAENGAPVLSRYRLMKSWAERAPQELGTMLSGDGFHMSDRGYGCLANAMVSAVTDLVSGTPPLKDRNAPAVTASVPRALTRP